MLDEGFLTVHDKINFSFARVSATYKTLNSSANCLFLFSIFINSKGKLELIVNSLKDLNLKLK